MVVTMSSKFSNFIYFDGSSTKFIELVLSYNHIFMRTLWGLDPRKLVSSSNCKK